jgi:LacI family transcriptional regulator
VCLDLSRKGPLISDISVDYAQGIGDAVRHLVSLGHRRIGFISGPAALKSARARREAFVNFLRESGISEREQIIVEGNHKIDGGQTAMEQLLSMSQPPTAVMTSNDLTAMGALRAITYAGLRVPDDISVIGFDDIVLSQFTQPPLTTVRLSREEVGRKAFNALYSAVCGERQVNREVKVSTSVVLRESTARVNSGR